MGQAPIRLGTTQHAQRPRGTPRGTRPAVMIGGTNRTIPLLSAAVGRPPSRNTPADTLLVDAAFAAIVGLSPTPAAGAAPPPNLLALAQAVRGYQADRATAISAFQRLEDIRDAENQDGVIAPDSLTWETLFTYGELARELATARDRPVNPADYIHTGGFDTAIFEAEATRRFGARADPDEGRYNNASIAGMQDLLGRLSRDPRVIDIRWIAYLLATAMWESYRPIDVPNASGRGTHRVMRWASPIEEVGKGRLNASDIKDYYLPVKVAPAPGGGATVTEQDGHVFTLDTRGRITAGIPANRGSNAFAAVTPVYGRAAGVEQAYYGRGYCQLTWWDNYASTGAEIGMGLELLFHPERALEADIAYEVMVHCMVYGLGFANGHRLQMYLSGARTDYVGARRMVNGTNHNRKIAAVAEVFEAALLAARR